MASSPVYEFVNFELFYDRWCTCFKQRSDPIVLFFHYMMIQNEFKLLHTDTLKRTELLPNDWNDFATTKGFVYYKQEAKVQLEVIKEEDIINFVAKRDNDERMISLVVNDYINPEYVLTDYTKVFNMSTVFQLYSSIQMCINTVRMEPQECDYGCGISCSCGKSSRGDVNQSPGHDLGAETAIQESSLPYTPASQVDPDADQTLSGREDQIPVLVEPKLEPVAPVVIKQPPAVRNCQVVLTDFTQDFLKLLKQQQKQQQQQTTATATTKKRASKRRMPSNSALVVKDEPVDHGGDHESAPAAKRVKMEPTVPAGLVASRARLARRNTVQLSSARRTSSTASSIGPRLSLAAQAAGLEMSSSIAMLHLDEVIDDLIKAVTNNP